jgi:uncharacterized protein (TIGR02246 family)
VRDAVDAGNRAFIAAFSKGDARAVSELYTEDAQVIAPGQPVAMGRGAVAAHWQKAIDEGVMGLELETQEVESSADLACETGVVRLTSKAGVRSEARYVVVWKRENEQWKLHRDIWNAAK